MDESWSKMIVEWFMQGDEASENIIDLKWEITDLPTQKGHLINAIHPKIPFDVTVLITEDLIKLGINTGIQTDFMDVVERLKIYKIMLALNFESSLVKIGISGIESTIMVGSDLKVPSLDKAELNDALSSMVMTTYAVFKYLGKEDVLNERAFQGIVQRALGQLEAGGRSEDVVDYLERTVGMDKKSAQDLVRSIKDSKKAQVEKEKEDTVYIG